jgi:colicin import membrane protein
MQMKTASVISTGLHLAVLAFAVVSFSGKTFEITPAESLPVDLISEKEFSELTKGQKDAPKKEAPKPLVEKKAEEIKPVEDSKPKVTEKPEVKATQEKTPPPTPEPEKKPVDKTEAKADKPPDPVAQEKADPIADKLKQAQNEPKPLPPRKPPQKQQPKFDADKIAALLDQREPRRTAAAGDTLNSDASLGYTNGAAARLSQSEIDAMRARLRECWNPPVGAADASKLFVVFRVMFKRDGSVLRDPVLVGGSASQFGPALAESAKRALLQCQPYKMLRPEHYDMWKDMEITFDPREMFGG